MMGKLRWLLAAAIVTIVGVVPVVYYRVVYTHSKRFREIEPDRVYRSGEMTADGFTEAITRHHIRTVINVQDEFPDPELRESYFRSSTTKESELCRRLGARYVYLPPDLISRHLIPEHRPEAIDKFLALMDDPDSYPVLIHCHAGLHRTGVLTAVYRMEYNGWDKAEAVRELKANGFGEWPCTSANDYIKQYILTYRPGVREKQSAVGSR
jgi:tyrosine-protein phosphatase SIW14